MDLAEYIRAAGLPMPGQGPSQVMQPRGPGAIVENPNAAPQPIPQRPNDPLAPAYQGAAEGMVGMSPPAIGYAGGQAVGHMAQEPNGPNSAALAMAFFPMLRGKLGAFLRGKQETPSAADAERLKGLQEETYKRTIANEAQREAGHYSNGMPRPVPTIVDANGHRKLDPAYRASEPLPGYKYQDQTNWWKIQDEIHAEIADFERRLAARPPGQTPHTPQSPPATGATPPSPVSASDGIGQPTSGPLPSRSSYAPLGSPENDGIRKMFMESVFNNQGIPPNPRDFNKAVQGAFDGVPNVTRRANETVNRLTQFEKNNGKLPETKDIYYNHVFATGKPGSIPKGTLSLGGLLASGALATGDKAKAPDAAPEGHTMTEWGLRGPDGQFKPQN